MRMQLRLPSFVAYYFFNVLEIDFTYKFGVLLSFLIYTNRDYFVYCFLVLLHFLILVLSLLSLNCLLLFTCSDHVRFFVLFQYSIYVYTCVSCVYTVLTIPIKHSPPVFIFSRVKGLWRPFNSFF